MSDMLLKVEDVATSVGVAASTIRKYSFLMETYGYTFSRTNQNALMYDHEEIAMFKELIQLKKNMSLDEAVKHVLSDIVTISETASTSDIAVADIASMADIRAMVSDMLAMQSQMKAILEQNAEVIAQNQQLMNKIELLQNSEKKQIGERDKLLMENIQQTKELKEMIVESQNKKWWKFGK